VAPLRAPAPPPDEQESVGTLVQRLGTDATRIVRAEVAALQVRLTGAVRVFKAAGGGLAAALLIGLAGFFVVVAAIVILVATVIPPWIAALAVGGSLLVIAAVLVAVELRVLTHGVSEVLSPMNGTDPVREAPRVE